MFLSRIKRGAIRTHILLRTKLDTQTAMISRSAPRFMRVAGLTTLAVQVVALPIMPLSSTRVFAASEEKEPPSTQVSLPDTTLKSIKITTHTPDLLVMDTAEFKLNSTQPGESRVAEQARVRAEEEARLARQQAEEEQARVEQARQLAELQAYRRTFISYSPPSVAASQDNSDTITYLQQKAAEKFGSGSVASVMYIVQRESGGNPNSVNSSSGACGLFQAYPCNKMGGMESHHQVEWGLNYIQSRYGSPEEAQRHWQIYHSY